MVFGQGLGAKHIERGARNMAAVDQGQQVFIDQMRTPRDVDDVSAGLQPTERVAVHHIDRLWGEWQQIHQHAAGCQKVVKAFSTAKGTHAVHGFGVAAPAVDRKIKLRQCFGHTLAEHAQAHDTNREIVAHPRLAVAPAPCPSVRLITVEFAKVANDGMAHIFGHLHRHASIIQTDHEHVGR